MAPKMQLATPAELRRRAEADPSITVMEATHDNLFEPWQPDRLMRCVRTVAATALAGGLAGVKAALDADPDELGEFARLHPMLYEKVSQPVTAGDPAIMGLVESMIRTRMQLDAGKLDTKEARERVSDAALAVAAARSPPAAASAPATAPPAGDAEAPAAAPDADEPRLVELDARVYE